MRLVNAHHVSALGLDERWLINEIDFCYVERGRELVARPWLPWVDRAQTFQEADMGARPREHF
jgi:hypothetical protein